MNTSGLWRVWTLSCCLAALAIATVHPRAAGAERLNVVLILADDLGWADLGDRSDLHETPHLQRLASEGTSFTQAYSPSPVCSPTRAGILTGKHPARLHITIWREGSLNPSPPLRKLRQPDTEPNLPLEQVTLAEALREAGYVTAHVGKWHLGDSSHYPEAHGFDLNIGGTHWGAPSTFFHPYSGRWANTDEFRYVPGLPFGHEGEYLTDRLTDEAIRVIDRAGERPFYLNLWYHNPHTPVEGKPELVTRYEQRIKPGLRHQNAHYAAMIRTLDENVGRVLAALEERGLAERTLVIFTSDNGGYIGRFRDMANVTNNAPLRSGKGSLYEGGIRVPLMVRLPSVVRGGASCDEPVTLHDLYPTIIEAAGLKVDAAHGRDLDGVSLMPLLRDPAVELPREALYWHYPHYYSTTTPVSAIRRGDWKLLHYYEDDRLELYNLADDLSEGRDLAAEQPQRARALYERLQQWRDRVNAQAPTAKQD